VTLGADDVANMGTIMQSAFMLLTTAISMWSHVVIADELPDCKTMRNAGKKMECLQNSIAILRKHATGNVIQMGSKAFGQNQSDSPNWSLQELPRAGPTSWTSPPISFAQQFATKPAVSVAIAGIESGANLDVDRFGFSAEATDINETGFKVTIRRSHGVLYGVTLNWLAYGTKKP
jgi:H-type lectin domain